VLRYQQGGDPKMLAVEGTRLGLIPHPAREISEHVVLVEGPPDMIAARSHGLPAIAIPGDHSWRAEWAQLLAGRRVTVVMDADGPGRELAERIAGDLRDVACGLLAVDLDRDRDDGYDLTDWLLEHPTTAALEQLNTLAQK
jgi:DNA primase